jgi:hypothetical protein
MKTLKNGIKKPLWFKVITILYLVVITLFAVISCEVSTTNTVRVYYDETECADKWGSSNIPESEKKQNVINYFDNLNIHIYDIQIINDGIEEECKACFCRTGYRIHCKIKEDDLSKIKKENFYE